MLAKAVLVVHVLAAVVALGPSGALPFLRWVRGRPPSVEVLRWASIMETQVAIFFAVQLVTGVWLIFLRDYDDDFGDARWLHVSLVLFLAAAIVAVGVNRRRVRRALRLSREGRGDDAIATLRVVEGAGALVMGALITAIVFLMVWQPVF